MGLQFDLHILGMDQAFVSSLVSFSKIKMAGELPILQTLQISSSETEMFPASVFYLRLIGSIPLQLSHFGDTTLLFAIGIVAVS